MGIISVRLNYPSLTRRIGSSALWRSLPSPFFDTNILNSLYFTSIRKRFHEYQNSLEFLVIFSINKVKYQLIQLTFTALSGLSPLISNEGLLFCLINLICGGSPASTPLEDLNLFFRMFLSFKRFRED